MTAPRLRLPARTGRGSDMTAERIHECAGCDLPLCIAYAACGDGYADGEVEIRQNFGGDAPLL